jgi:O-antigen/teichoic acid export membrane protein
VGLVFSLIGMLVLARLLTPEHFGIYALAFAVFGIAEELTFFGLESNLVRDKTFSKERASNAAGLSLLFALSAIALAGLAALLLSGTGAGMTAMLLAVLCTSLLVKPLVLPIEAAYAHGLRFGLLSISSALMLAVEAGVGIAVAISSPGPYALAFGFVAGRFARAVLLTFGARHILTRPSFDGLTSFFSFGSAYSFATLLPKVSDTVTKLGVGGVLGAAPLGILDRSRTLLGLLDRTVLDGIKPVVLPAILRTAEKGEAMGTVYARKVDYLSVLVWPVYTGLAILAAPMVAVFLGDQWTGAILPLQILCLSGFGVPFARMSLKVFTALGDIGTLLRIQNILVVARAVLIVPASLHSIEMVCGLITAALVVKGLWVAHAVKRRVQYDTKELYRVLLRNFAMAGLVALAASTALLLTKDAVAFSQLAAGIAACALALAAALIAFNHPLVQQARALLPLPARLRRRAA